MKHDMAPSMVWLLHPMSLLVFAVALQILLIGLKTKKLQIYFGLCI